MEEAESQEEVLKLLKKIDKRVEDGFRLLLEEREPKKDQERAMQVLGLSDVDLVALDKHDKSLFQYLSPRLTSLSLLHSGAAQWRWSSCGSCPPSQQHNLGEPDIGVHRYPLDTATRT